MLRGNESQCCEFYNRDVVLDTLPWNSMDRGTCPHAAERVGVVVYTLQSVNCGIDLGGMG